MGIRLLEITGRYSGGLKDTLDVLNEDLAKSPDIESIHHLMIGREINPEFLLKKLTHSIDIAYDVDRCARYSPQAILKAYRTIDTILSDNNINILHIHTLTGSLPSVASLVANSRHIPVVVTYHGSKIDSLSGNIRLKAVSAYIRNTAKKKIAVSKAAQYLLGEDSEVIDVPVRREYFDEPTSTTFFSEINPQNHPVLFYPARVEPNKGQIDLLSVTKILLEQGLRNFKVIIAGSVDDTEYASLIRVKSQEIGITQNFVMYDLIAPRDMRKAYCDSAILIFPTYSEGLGKIIVEAGLCRVPTLAYSVGGVPEVVEHARNGYLVLLGDVKEFADRTARLLNNKDLRSVFGNNSRYSYMSRFNPGPIAARHLEIYSSLADN